MITAVYQNGNLGVYVMPVDSFKWKHYEGEIILLKLDGTLNIR
jgi:hypothetical protein